MRRTAIGGIRSTGGDFGVAGPAPFGTSFDGLFRYEASEICFSVYDLDLT